MEETSGRILGLRTCNAKRQGYGGFQWPESGTVEAPDWNTESVCHGGLFFLPWGCGDAYLLSRAHDAVWMVVAADAESIVRLGGKAKARCVEVLYCGDREGAVAYILANGGAGKACAFARVTGGDDSTVTGGYNSTVTGGERSTVTGGERSTVTGGDDSTVTGGYNSTVTGGDDSTVTGGYNSTVTGGDGSTLLFYHWDYDAMRRRVVVAYVGEEGIEAGVAYRLDDSGKVARADGEGVDSA